RAGEVHALAGTNGAGKSTLIRILGGAVDDFAGRLLLDGVETRFTSPLAATRAGIACIHQELSLVDALTVADNLFLGDPGSLFGLLRRSEERARARRLLDELGLDVDPDA